MHLAIQSIKAIAMEEKGVLRHLSGMPTTELKKQNWLSWQLSADKWNLVT
jgi:hypothetical protein